MLKEDHSALGFFALYFNDAHDQADNSAQKIVDSLRQAADRTDCSRAGCIQL